MLSARSQIILAGLLANFAVMIHAANPILQGYADPAVRVWDGRADLAVGKDLSPTAKGFAMPYWAIHATTKMVAWRLGEIIGSSLVAYMGKGNLCGWASGNEGAKTERSAKNHISNKEKSED